MANTMVSILLIESHILGNSTASRRFREILSNIENVDLRCLSITQDEIDSVKLPRFVKRFQSIPTYLSVRQKLVAENSSRQYDIVLCVTAQPLLALHGLFKSARIALWYDALPFHPGKGIANAITNWLTKTIYNVVFRRVQILLPMSNWAFEQNRQFKFSHSEIIETFPICVSEKNWRLDKVRHIESGRKINVLLCGNDARRKGFIDFFQWCVDHDKDLSNFKFKVITTEKNEKFIQLAKKLGIEIIDSLSHDNLSEIISHYHTADIFFLPTKFDMMPNVLIEAVAAKLPVLSTDTGAINEVVKNGHTGWLVQCGDWQGFYNRLIQFSNNPNVFDEQELLVNASRFYDSTSYAKIARIIDG